MPPGAVIGAQFQAGGFYDFTKWQLCIDDEGNLFQWIQDSPNETRQEQVFLGQDAVLQLLLRFEELGFALLPDQLPAPPPSGCSDDYLSTYLLVLRWNGVEKYVIAPADSPHPDRHKFQALWDAVHAHLPKQA
ncbi:hypothetical protein [Armatimonas rosea]|uniref:Uncharacterized protein n=1 Tax=Armatimonas rosea TaxID=685828 RepID=A0A7W9SW31_ARMRO|nr:hypothetical protein [Armatimonas rosea]MBB6053766.1 hypothetical protein [Armatimonas rosea]